ncbi:MAG: hypothetical protein GY847_12575 [Proteobacteria bacterium]|nr:hypothetical protein [Pseudomonadota bacterium]
MAEDYKEADFAQKLEGAIASAGEHIARFFRTLLTISVRPAEALKMSTTVNAAVRARYTPPLSFLSLVWILYSTTGIDRARQSILIPRGGISSPDLFSKGVSLGEVIVSTIPLFIGLMMLSTPLQRLASGMKAEGATRITRLLCYFLSTHFVLVTAVGVISNPSGERFIVKTFAIGDYALDLGVAGLSILAIFLYSSTLLTVGTIRLRKQLGHGTRLARWGAIFIASMYSLMITLFLSQLLYLTGAIAAKPIRHVEPVLVVEPTKELFSSEAWRLTFTISNPSKDPFLIRRDFCVPPEGALRESNLRMIAWSSADPEIMFLKSGDTAWFILEADILLGNTARESTPVLFSMVCDLGGRLFYDAFPLRQFILLKEGNSHD